MGYAQRAVAQADSGGRQGDAHGSAAVSWAECKKEGQHPAPRRLRRVLPIGSCSAEGGPLVAGGPAQKRAPPTLCSFFLFLCPLAPPVPDRPVIAPVIEASSCSAIGGRQRNAAAIRQSQSRMSDRQQQRSFPFPHACPLRLVGHACPLPQGTWVASCQDGRGRSAGSSRSGLAGSAMAVLIAD